MILSLLYHLLQLTVYLCLYLAHIALLIQILSNLKEEVVFIFVYDLHPQQIIEGQ